MNDKNKLELPRFTIDLLNWFDTQNRELPWKETKNPYFIWLSEIILQQTRVEQGLPYFLKFTTNYPTIQDLANAPEDEVMKMWEGLGYYSRARNLHFTAKYISNELNGIFPNTYEEIIKLKGVGAYTAAAIASFAYKLPHAVVDGNVYRVLSRVFGIETPIDTTQGKKEFNQIAQELLHKDEPDTYNQAIMDFGATHCKPKLPKCKTCPMQVYCQGFQQQKVTTLPIKSKKLVKKKRYFNYLHLKVDDQTLVRKRTEKDIWRNLYEFPMIESDNILTEEALKSTDLWKQLCAQSSKIINISAPVKQTLTHQIITAVFWEITIQKPTTEDYLLVNPEELKKLAFPKLFNCYFEDKSLYLKLF